MAGSRSEISRPPPREGVGGGGLSIPGVWVEPHSQCGHLERDSTEFFNQNYEQLMKLFVSLCSTFFYNVSAWYNTAVFQVTDSSQVVQIWYSDLDMNWMRWTWPRWLRAFTLCQVAWLLSITNLCARVTAPCPPLPVTATLVKQTVLGGLTCWSMIQTGCGSTFALYMEELNLTWCRDSSPSGSLRPVMAESDRVGETWTRPVLL